MTLRGSVAKVQDNPSLTASDVVEISVPDTMKTLYARRKTILAVLGFFLALGILYAILPNRYEADGTLWVEPGESSASEVSSLASMISGQTSDIVASETLALTSRTMLLQVADELDLVHQRGFWGMIPLSWPPADQRSLKIPKTRDAVYKQMMQVVDVENDGKDEIITISVSTISPELSAKITNTLINDYLLYLFKMRYDANNRSSVWLLQQLGNLKQRVDKDQEELTKLQGQLGVVGFTQSTAQYLYGESLGELMKASDEATIERIVAEAKYRYLKDSDPNLIEGEINILPEASGPTSEQSLLESLRATKAQSASAYARMLSELGPKNPEVVQQKAQLDAVTKEVDQEQQRILNQAQLSFNAASANETMANSKVESEKSKVFNSHDAMVRFVLLMQDYNSDRSLYESLISHLQEAGITAGLQAGDIDIVDMADLPGAPKQPKWWIAIILSVIVGLIFGCVAALWMANMDHRILGPEQVEKLTGLPVLAQVPHVKIDKGASGKGELPYLIATARRSHYAEAIQSLRASLMLTRPGASPKVILVSSSTPNEGKSLTVINLAATFARHGAKVLVCDCDLRRGTIAQRLRLSASKGVTSVLTRQMSLEEATQELPGVPGLFVLADGPRPPDAAVMIGSDEMRQVVAACREEYDIVILDSPPILGIADGLHLGQLADTVILVVRESVSNRKAVEETVSMMMASHLPVSGFVFNDVDPRAARYGYGYSYRDSYRDYYIDSKDVPPAGVSQ
jgi:succinoglycan biosynthesis transport protein ExoP